jgi:hypothetical protein
VTTPIGDRSVLDTGPSMTERAKRLRSGATDLAEPPEAPDLPTSDRRRIAVAGTFIVVGLAAILLGYLGASRSIVVAEQIPFLISGGLLGLGLTIVGGCAFFVHWIELHRREIEVSERRSEERHLELLTALEARLARRPGEEGDGTAARSNGRERPLRRAPSRQGR